MLGTTGTNSGNIYSSGPTTSQSVSPSALPTNGGTLFVTLESLISGSWMSEHYTFIESGTPAPATLSAPSPGSKVGTSATFSWTAGTGVTEYALHLGTTGAGSANIYNSLPTASQSVSPSGLPTSGGTLFVTVCSLIDGSWQYEFYSVTESGTAAPATLSAPSPGSTVGSSSTFSWTAGTGVTSYQLALGSNGAGSSNVEVIGPTTSRSFDLSYLPTSGGTLFVALKSLIDGAWQTENYTFTETGTAAAATLTSPASGTVLGPAATFSWTPGTGVTEYQLLLGTQGASSSNLYKSVITQNRSVTISNLPRGGQTLYVTLESLIDGNWTFENYTYALSSSAAAVAVYPVRAGLVTGQSLKFTAKTKSGSGVDWSVTGPGCSGSACGTFSPTSSASGAPVTFTAASTAGAYTVTATSAANNTLLAKASVAVTDLAGVLTYHNDLARDGANTQEYALTPSTVSSTTFGKLFSCAVDGAIFAQPLWVPKVTIGTAVHNVVFVATQHDSLYAFDADSNTTPCAALWHVSLIDGPHGGTSGETSVPSYPGNMGIGSGSFDIAPEVGVTGTPVIDPTTNTLYVVSKSCNEAETSFYQRLHAINLVTGSEKFGKPVTIAATFPGTGDDGTTTTFVPQQENQRAGLVLSNGVVYIAWASHEDTYPYYGWVMGYNASNLTQVSVFNDTPNAGAGGIWMSGAAPAVDEFGNIYVLTGNGNFDANSSSAPNNDYGDSLLQFNGALQVQQYFTPSDQQTDNESDQDFGSGGALVLADIPANGSNPTHLIIGGGKDGALYVNNRDHLGGYGDSNAWQVFNLGNSIFAMGAFWNDTYYVAPISSALQPYTLNLQTAKLTQMGAASSATFGYPGSTPSISSMPDNSNGIAWALDNSQYCRPGTPGCAPTILHALEATNLSNELWNSSQASSNTPGNGVKFTVPTVANGKVYVGTRGNNTGDPDTSTSIPGELEVYGLLPY
ncbi:MAG TPA: hypothetical protein VIY53_05950 [Acidobacteriaceae bacterium]